MVLKKEWQKKFHAGKSSTTGHPFHKARRFFAVPMIFLPVLGKKFGQLCPDRSGTVVKQQISDREKGRVTDFTCGTLGKRIKGAQGFYGVAKKIKPNGAFMSRTCLYGKRGWVNIDDAAGVKNRQPIGQGRLCHNRGR